MADAFDKVAKAKKILDGWDRKCKRPDRFFYPVVKAEYNRAWDAYHAAKDAAFEADPWRYLTMFFNECMAWSHKLPAAFNEEERAAVTDDDVRAVIARWRAEAERLEAWCRESGVDVRRNQYVNTSTWTWRHSPSNFRAGPFPTKIEAMQHAEADLTAAGVVRQAAHV